MNNSRYIKTPVDGIPKILHMFNCNLCPLMLFDVKPKITRCSKYCRKNSNKIY